MLRILVLSTLFPDRTRPNFGIFVERQTLGLAERADVAVEVVAPLGLPPFPLSRLGGRAALAALPHREDWKGLTVHRPRFLSMPGLGGRLHRPMLTRALIPMLTNIRRTFPFDVISAEFFFPDGLAAVEAGRHFGVPVSIKARGSDIHAWAAPNSPVRGQIIMAGQAADGLLAVSEPLRRDLVALGMPAQRSAVIHTGVDFTRFGGLDRQPARAALGIAHPLVLSVGALIPLKGHALVMEAVASLPGVHHWIAGSGPLETELRRHADRLGIADRVRLLGGVPQPELPPILAAADVMALASEREGLANAWLEALASGTPVVIPDVGGARDVVTAPAAGRIVDRTPAAFAAALAELLAAPPPADAVRAVAQPFTWAANSDRLHAFLQDLVDRRHQRGDPALT